MQETEQSSYRSIFKATSLFGGVQVFQILIAVVRSKIIAVLLGPNGVGIIGLYQSATALIQSISAMGLSSSAVRDVSEANGTGDFHKISFIVSVLRKLVWFTGILGSLIVILLSPLLSRTTFGNDDYILPFVFLSSTLLIDQLCAGQKVVLQGLRKLKDLAKASLFGSTAGLLFTIPLYYYLGVEGIVPTLILNSIITLFFTWFFSKKIKLEKIKINTKQTIKGGAIMLKMGIAMSYSSVLVYASSYLMRGFIRSIGGTESVGLVTAAFTILSSYVGMIFTAISTDYYPRLAASCKNNQGSNEIVNQQGEIAVLIIGPMLLSCIVYINLFLKILYSPSFIAASDCVFWAVLGMMFKLGSWLISYQIIARGDMKNFVVNETLSNVYSFVISIIGYKLWGLSGLGLAFTIGYLIYFIQIYYITHKYYQYEMSRPFVNIFLIELCMVIVCMIIVKLLNSQPLIYVVGTLFVLPATMYSIKELNTRMNLIAIFKNKL